MVNAVVRPTLLAGLCLALSTAAAAAQPALREGGTLSGTLDRRGERTFALEVEAGAYVSATVDAEGGAYTLDLLDPAGRAVRRLADAARNRSSVMFSAEGPGPAALRLTAADGLSRFTVTVERIVPVAEQKATAEPPLSREIAALAAGGDVAAFWQSVAARGTPLVEPGARPGTAIVTFLWRGAARNVRLFAAPSGDHDELRQLAGTDVWYASYAVPTSTRLSYQLAPDVPEIPGSARDRRRAVLATAQADPLNRTPWPADAPDKFAQESLLVLPDAPPQPWIEPRDGPRGTLTTHRFVSRTLGNAREVTIYKPPGAVTKASAALLIVFDAHAYLGKVPTPTILDNLIAAGRMAPVTAVFVANPDSATRARELPCNPRFADALADELLPWLRTRIGRLPQAGRTVLAGSSYGGLAAACTAFRRPEAFGAALSQSGSFWWSPTGQDGEAAEPEQFARLVAAAKKRPVRFYLSGGLFEGGRPGSPGILETTRHLRDVLTARGYRVTHEEHAAGHDYVSWRGTLADGLQALLPPAGRR